MDSVITPGAAPPPSRLAPARQLDLFASTPTRVVVPDTASPRLAVPAPIAPHAVAAAGERVT